MTKNKFLMSLNWELKNYFRFPFSEIILALFTYMIFLQSGMLGGFTVLEQNLAWNEITAKLAGNAVKNAAYNSISAYVPMGIFASIFATLAFAHEIENGLLKVYLSHPISRRTIFLSKLLSCFLVVFTTLSASLLACTLMYIPENNIYVILSLTRILELLLIAMLETLFVTSVAISFSLFSKKASISLVGSFTLIYLIQLVTQNVRLEFLPTLCFQEQVSFFFGVKHLHNDPVNLLTIPFVSVFLLILSYLYFSRRLEIS